MPAACERAASRISAHRVESKKMKMVMRIADTSALACLRGAQVYRNQIGEWDCVATCFFIDTASNIVQVRGSSQMPWARRAARGARLFQ